MRWLTSIKKSLAVILSVCLIITSIPKNSHAQSFLAPPTGDISLRQTIHTTNTNKSFYQVASRGKRTKKCLVLDCDGVLWDGIIGEDGIEGIKITPAHIALQKKVKELKEKGIILAINSKNNPEDVEKILDKHPNMILRRDDFVAVRINWKDKANNMRELAEELNIGIDSFVFLDDSPHERELIRMIHPEVLTPELPDNPEERPRLIDALGVFTQGAVTDEDKRRTELYEAKRKRDELKEGSKSLEDYYRSLNMVAIIREGNENEEFMPRILQLINRTNQFNLASKRYTEEEFKNMFGYGDGSHPNNYDRQQIYSLELVDKFGNNGIVGVIILGRRGYYNWDTEYYIDTFCLSCRTIGLGIEQAFLGYIIKGINERH